MFFAPAKLTVAFGGFLLQFVFRGGDKKEGDAQVT